METPQKLLPQTIQSRTANIPWFGVYCQVLQCEYKLATSTCVETHGLQKK